MGPALGTAHAVLPDANAAGLNLVPDVQTFL